jgi:hypothetical protein
MVATHEQPKQRKGEALSFLAQLDTIAVVKVGKPRL